MGKRRTPRAIEWLLREGSLRQAVIGDSLRSFLTKAEIHRGLTLEPMQSVSGVWLCSKVAIKGRVSVSFSDGAHIELTPDRSMLCRPRDGSARFTPKPRQRLHLAGYMLRADRVVRLCDGEVPEAIRPLIASTTDRDLLLKVPATAHLLRAANRMFDDTALSRA